MVVVVATDGKFSPKSGAVTAPFKHTLATQLQERGAGREEGRGGGVAALAPPPPRNQISFATV